MDNDLKLPFSFTCWVQVLDASKEYNETLHQAFTFSTIKQFWTFYQHMYRPQKLKQNDNIYIFKEGIHPTWEAEENKNGGCVKVKLKKTKSGRNWEDIILMMISPNNKFANQINGIRLKVKEKFDEVQLWIKGMQDEKIQVLKEYIRKTALNDEDVIIDYKNFAKK